MASIDVISNTTGLAIVEAIQGINGQVQDITSTVTRYGFSFSNSTGEIHRMGRIVIITLIGATTTALVTDNAIVKSLPLPISDVWSAIYKRDGTPVRVKIGKSSGNLAVQAAVDSGELLTGNIVYFTAA